MTSTPRKLKNTKSFVNLIPAEFAYIFEDKPVLWFEQEALYHRVLADFVADLIPATLLEYHWTKNIADTQWEIMRHNRLRSAALIAEMPDATSNLLGHEFYRQAERLGIQDGGEGLKRVIRLAGAGNAWSKEKVDSMVESASITHDVLLYKSYAVAGSTLSEIANRLLKLEQRRDDLIRRFHQRRQSLAAHQKSLIDKDHDAEVVDLDQSSKNGKDK